MALDVDPVRRTVAGPAVPYGPDAIRRAGGRRFRFNQGWAHPAPPVRLLRDHDEAQRLGSLVSFADTLDGLHILVRVYRGRAGDRALALAAEGRLWFSVTADPTAVTPDPLNQGVGLILGADLTEVSLTDRPAFDWR